MKEIAKLIMKDPHLRTEIDILEALEIRKRVSDQSSLTEVERIQNLEGALGVRPDISGKSVIVIDDVITTGSTLREAIRVLEERNLTIIGAATACATQRRLAIG
jgi:predicted amidophosphoribosyltransferase